MLSCRASYLPTAPLQRCPSPPAARFAGGPRRDPLSLAWCGLHGCIPLNTGAGSWRSVAHSSTPQRCHAGHQSGHVEKAMFSCIYLSGGVAGCPHHSALGWACRTCSRRAAPLRRCPCQRTPCAATAATAVPSRSRTGAARSRDPARASPCTARQQPPRSCRRAPCSCHRHSSRKGTAARRASRMGCAHCTSASPLCPLGCRGRCTHLPCADAACCCRHRRTASPALASRAGSMLRCDLVEPDARGAWARWLPCRALSTSPVPRNMSTPAQGWRDACRIGIPAQPCRLFLHASRCMTLTHSYIPC